MYTTNSCSSVNKLKKMACFVYCGIQISSAALFMNREVLYIVAGPWEGLKNRGCQLQFDGHNLPPLVEVGLSDLPKSGGAMAPPPGSYKR